MVITQTKIRLEIDTSRSQQPMIPAKGQSHDIEINQFRAAPFHSHFSASFITFSSPYKLFLARNEHLWRKHDLQFEPTFITSFLSVLPLALSDLIQDVRSARDPARAIRGSQRMKGLEVVGGGRRRWGGWFALLFGRAGYTRLDGIFPT